MTLMATMRRNAKHHATGAFSDTEIALITVCWTGGWALPTFGLW
jgi:hypothetical protein